MMPTRSMHDQDSPESIRFAFIQLQRAATDARSRAATWRRLDVLDIADEETRIADDYESRLNFAAAILEGGLSAEQLRRQRGGRYHADARNREMSDRIENRKLVGTRTR